MNNTNQLRIELIEQQFEPGDWLKGKLHWNLTKPPQQITLHIGWYTEGRGTKDSCIEFEHQYSTEFLTGVESFSFQLPHAPYSFSGKLIELLWYVSAEVKKGDSFARQDIIVGPNKSRVNLVGTLKA